jgi:hypothetical protein
LGKLCGIRQSCLQAAVHAVKPEQTTHEFARIFPASHLEDIVQQSPRNSARDGEAG